MHSTDNYDRWMGYASLTFFGGGAITLVLIEIVNRGSRAALSPALRLHDDAPPTLDRLELRIAPLRVALYVFGALFFSGAVAIILAFAASTHRAWRSSLHSPL